MKIIKIAGRKIKYYIMGVKMPNGQIVQKVFLLPNQGLGESCHNISQALLPKGHETNSWTDRPKDEVMHDEEVAYEQPEGLSR